MNVNERTAALLAELAQDLKDSHTVNGDWRGDTEARSSYNQMLALSQGLKAGIHFITAAPVKPDDDGFWTHPAIPDHFDEDPAPFQRWLNEQLLECVTREVGDDHGGIAPDWTDSKPAGARWFLLELIDTEDGPTAFWARRNVAFLELNTLSGLERDALRYRWLRLKDNFPGDEDQERSLWDDLCDQDADEFDAWVDRHMEEDQREKSDA